MNFYEPKVARDNKATSFIKRPTVSIVVPMYNAAKYIHQCIDSVIAQTYKDFEIVAVDDGSPDNCSDIIKAYEDPRIRLVQQKNRGLAGARNTGIRQSNGRYIAFLDADDSWHPEKLERHVGHLDHNKRIGVSYSGSAFMDEDGNPLGLLQTPKLYDVTARDIFCRNPIGNGSAPVIRREVLDDIKFLRPEDGHYGHQYFDESFRQSEDVECWLRIALSTQWQFEGVEGALTNYRVNGEGLSANWKNQLAAWERSVVNNAQINMAFILKWENLARAYQYRYLARRAVQSRDANAASELILRALQFDSSIIFREFKRTSATLGAAFMLYVLRPQRYNNLEKRVVDIMSV